MLASIKMSPRVAPAMSPRSINEASFALTDWMLRQSEIREMLGSARGRVKAQPPPAKPEATFATYCNLRALKDAPAWAHPPMPAELPHQRVARESANRRAKTQARMQAQQDAAEAAARAAAEAAAAAAGSRRQMDAQSHPLGPEMVKTQAKLKEWFLDENSRFRRIWRAMDDDKNGYATREELRTLGVRTNLEFFVRPHVLDALIDLMDIDGDGRILYNEFVRVIMADDVFNP